MSGFRSPFIEKIEESNKSKAERASETFEDLMTQIIIGTASFLEGVKDKALTTVGQVGGIFNREYEKEIEKRVAEHSRFVENAHLYQRSNLRGSYINEMGQEGQDLVRGVGQGVGNMIPALAVGQLGAGIGLSTKAAYFLSNAVFFAGSAGMATEQALNEGATFDQATTYGNLVGSVELITERIFGGMTTNVFGKGVMDNVLRNVNKSKVAKLALDVVGEGAEEALAEIINPLLQKITYDEDAAFWDDEHKQAVLQAAVIGGLTSIAYGKTLGRMQTGNQDIMESVQDISYLQKKANKEFSRGLLNDSTINELNTSKKALSEKLGKMNDTARAAVMKEFKLNEYFNEDGSIVEDNKVNYDAVTPQARVGKLPQVDIATNVSQEQKSTLRIGAKLGYKVVIADNLKTQDGQDANGYYDPDTKTIVISSQKSNPNEVLVHELTHTLEGTKQYAKFADFVLQEGQTNKLLKAKIKELGIDLETIRKAYSNQGKTKQGKDYVALTEYVAYATSEVLFKDEATINKMIETQDKSTVQKIYNWIKDTVKKISKSQSMSKDERAYLNMIKKAEKLYSKALENPTGGIRISDIDDIYGDVKRYSVADLRKESIRKALAGELKQGETVHLGFTPEFLIDLGFKQRPLSITVKHLKTASDGTKHNIPISYFESLFNGALNEPAFVINRFNNSYVFVTTDIIDDGPVIIPIKKDAADAMINGITVDVNMVLSVYGKRDITSYISKNEENIIYWDKEKATELVTTSRLQLSATVNSIASKTILKQIDKNVNNKRYSITMDSQGNELSVEQQEYFRDTKVLDENGNLKVVYHGTPNNFTVFNNDQRNTGNELSKLGFWFTEDVKMAENFAGNIVWGEVEKTEQSHIKNVYLNLKNPKVYEGNDLSSQKEKALEKYHNLHKQLYRGFLEDYAPIEKKWRDGEVTYDEYYKERQKVQKEYDLLAIELKRLRKNDSLEVMMDERDQFAEYINGTKGVKGAWRESYVAMKPDEASIEFKEYLISQGYDGIVLKDSLYDSPSKTPTDVYVAFNSNQVKLTTNKTPTQDNDIRYSLQGTKVVDDQGQPLLVHHGSPIADIKQFDPNKGGTNTGVPEKLIYFTNDIDTAKTWSNEYVESEYTSYLRKPTGKVGRVYDAYLNMQKPLDLRKLNINDINNLVEMYKEELGLSDDMAKKLVEINMEANNNQILKTAITREQLQKYGYDGLIAHMYGKDKNIIEYGIINGNQVVSPNDIVNQRYSLNIDGKVKNVSDTEHNDLIAIHNLSEKELMSTLRLGGFPMPSIAITKPGMKHDNFGNITVVFGKETIDPSYSKNKVWSGDKWTPSFPNIEYKINNDVFNEIYFYMLDNKDKIEGNPTRFESSNVQSKLDNLGKEDFIDYLLRNEMLQQYHGLTKQSLRYEEWVNDLVNKAIIKEGIYNNKDYFTSSGNRRSFEALHYDVTLDNIVRSMVANNGKQFGSGIGLVNASTIKNYRSIAQMKDDSGKIVDPDTYDKNREIHAKELMELTSKVADNLKYKDSNRLFDFDNAETYIIYIGEEGGTKNAAKKVFDEFGVSYNDALLNEVETFFKSLKNKLVLYFEAKPERAVDLKEIKQVLIPNTASSDLIKALENNGVQYTTYDPNTQSRSEIIDNLPDARFSMNMNLVEEFRNKYDITPMTPEEISIWKQTTQDNMVKNGYKRFVEFVPVKTLLSFNEFDRLDLGQDVKDFDQYMLSLLDSVREQGINNPLILEFNPNNNFIKLGEGNHRLSVAAILGIDEIPVRASRSNYMKPDKFPRMGAYVEYIKPIKVDEWSENKTKYYAAEEKPSYVLGSNLDTSNIASLHNQNDVRFSLSKGQVAKKVANYTKPKKYNKKDAEAVINTIINEYMVFANMDGELPNMNKQEVIEKLWLALNTKDEGQRGTIALEIAQYIIENAIAEDIYADANNAMDIEFLSMVKGYKGHIDISGIKTDIKHHFGKDNSPLQTWGKRKNNAAVDMETVAQELKQMGISLDGNTAADLFIDLHTKYKAAQDSMKKQAKALRSELSKNEYTELKNNIVREVLNAWDNYGKQTVVNKEITKYQGLVKDLKTRLRDARQVSFAISKMFKTIDRVNGLEKYQSVEDIPLSQEIVSAVKLLRKIKTWRGNLASADAVRNIFRKYSSKVADENGKQIPLYNLYHKMNNDGTFGDDNPYAELIETIANGKGELTVDDFNAIDQILTNFIHNVKNYDKAIFEGREQSMSELVEKAISETVETIPVIQSKTGSYKRWIESPIWRFERLSNFKKDGYFYKMYRELHEGVSRQAAFKRDVAEHYKEFFKKHRKEVESWRQQNIDFNGVKISKGQLISLYMLSQREQAQTHLYNVDDGSGKIRLADEKLAKDHRTNDAVNQGKDVNILKGFIEGYEFSDIETEYIKLTEEFFNKMSKDAKTEIDVQLFGVTNVEDGKYFPIRVSDDVLYKQIGDAQSEFNNLFSVYGASFNKNVKRNANNKVVIENVLDVVERHTQQMSAYYGLAVPIKTFNRVWNKKADDTNLKSEVASVDPSFQKYVGKLLKDIQGARVELSTFDRNFGKIRGWWARAALGLNPKVWTTQFASLWAAGGVGMKYKNLVKGLGKGLVGKTDYETLYKYSPMLYDRAREGNNVDVGLLKRDAGILGNVDKLTDLTTKPIGMIDNLVVGSVWNAALEQTKNDYKPFSEEHYKTAAKLTEEAVIKTQANWSPLYRPDILRTQSSLLQAVTMFTSEPLQVFSQIAGSIEKIKVAKQLGDKALLAEAKQEARHYAMSITLNAMFLTMVGMVFKWIKFGEDDEEKWLETALQELAGHFIGIFPIFRDFYSLWQGYELSNMYETGINNIYKGYESVSNIITKGIIGKEAYDWKDFKRDGRQLLLGITQTFGVPLKNLETYLKGILEKFNQSMVYKWEDNFYNQSYSKDLQKALEKGDEELADTIVETMFRDKNITVSDGRTLDLISDLYKEGYDVSPRAVARTMIIDDETVKLTQSQFNKFKNTYNQSDSKINKMTNLASFKTMSKEAQSKAIRYVYDYYYNLAKEGLTGEEYSGSFGAVANYVSVDKIAVIKAYMNTIEADTRNGSIVNGSKKIKVKMMLNRMGLSRQQKALILEYLGYSQDYMTTSLESYIRSQKVSQSQLEILLSYTK